MPQKAPTFGQFINVERRRRLISQKDFAAMIRKEDGQPMSSTYLNDIEHDRCNVPSEHILKQIAKLLDVDLNTLYFHAGSIPIPVPANIRRKPVEQEKIRAAVRAFMETLAA